MYFQCWYGWAIRSQPLVNAAQNAAMTVLPHAKNSLTTSKWLPVPRTDFGRRSIGLRRCIVLQLKCFNPLTDLSDVRCPDHRVLPIVLTPTHRQISS